ncbi:MAG: hypothetical protein WA939_20350 [Nodosilinea sp.]
MFDQPSEGSAIPTSFTLPTYQPDRLCHILLGDHAALVAAINRMEVLGYCDRVAWIAPIPTGRSGEYISLTNRRIVPPGG